MAGAREVVRVGRHSGPDDLLDSAIAGFGTGAIIGRLRGLVTNAHVFQGYMHHHFLRIFNIILFKFLMVNVRFLCTATSL